MDKKVSLYLGAVLFVLPFFFATGLMEGEPIRWAKIVWFLYLSIPIYFMMLKDRFGVFVAAFSSFLLYNAVYTGFGVVQQNSFLMFNLVLFSSYLIQEVSRDFVRRILMFLAVGGAIIALYGYWQCFFKDPVFGYLPGVEVHIPRGFFGQETVYAPWMVCTYLACLWLSWWPLALLIAPTIVMTKSSFALLCLGGGTWVYLYWLLDKKVFWTMTVAAVILGSSILYHKRNSDWLDSNGRMENWKKTVWLYQNFQPRFKLLGAGLGTYKAYYPQYQPQRNRDNNGIFESAHNEYLQFLFELGAIGMAFIIGFFGWIFRETFLCQPNRWKFAGFSLFLVMALDSFGSFPYHLMPHAVLAMWSFFLVVRYTRRVK